MVSSLLLLAAAALPYSADEGHLAGRSEWPYVDVVPDLSQARFTVALKTGGGLLQDMVPPSFQLAVNGGYFDKAYAPTTWLVSGGKELRSPNNASKGGVFAVRGATPFIGRRADLPWKD